MLAVLLLACQAPTSDTGPEPAVADPQAPTWASVTPSGLTADAEAAVALLPAWLHNDVRLALKQVDTEHQDEIAAQVLDLDDPALLDEVGFGIAHLSPEVLDTEKFHPELLVANARQVYAVDPLLDYVELVETGTPEVDADWWTTTRYNVVVDGVATTMELARDDYYWFVVHPRIEDEHPWYVDAWDECGSAKLECAKTPDTGTFWRDFLWDLAGISCPEGASCPVLADVMPGITTYWGDPDGNDAVHAIASFMLSSPAGSRWFSFGAHDERSIQPNRIYGLGRGNCGEWADMTTALSRTALIPNVNVTPSSWDHTWNAFLTDRWVAWEPVNWAFDAAYGSSYATYAARGDASVWYQTEQYNTNHFELDLSVEDAAGNPVDGATVTLWSAYEDSWWFAGELGTRPDGVASVTLGANLAFAYMVTSPLGEFPGDGYIDAATDGTPAGEVTSLVVPLDGTVPVAPQPSAVGLPADGVADATLSVVASFEGRIAPTSWRYDESWSAVDVAPPISTWVMSEADFAAFEAGAPFEVVADDLASVALPSSSRWVVVFANAGTVATSALGTVDLTLTPTSDAASTVDSTWHGDVVLRPGEHFAVSMTPGG